MCDCDSKTKTKYLYGSLDESLVYCAEQKPYEWVLVRFDMGTKQQSPTKTNLQRRTHYIDGEIVVYSRKEYEMLPHEGTQFWVRYVDVGHPDTKLMYVMYSPGEMPKEDQEAA